jgi:alkylhydroperoxidase family enzyme
VTLDGELVEALETDYRTAPITLQERVMVDYVVQLTKDATRIRKDDIDGLRSAGFDDRGILQITMICGLVQFD